MPVYIRITVPAGIDQGEYRFNVQFQLPQRSPGLAAGSSTETAAAVTTDQGALAVTVSELALPTEPRVLGVMTTTMARLAQLYPESFAGIAGNSLDRTDPDHQAAVQALDALVRAAKREGMGLFVEDLIPVIKLNEFGAVALDWDAYDRVMQPYMDGTAFDDRVPEAVWLAPVPPLRIRDSSTQLWQYIDACAKHFAEKGWIATPAFLHPALAENRPPADSSAASGDDEKLREQVSEMMRLHMPREMLAVATPDAVAPLAAPAGAQFPATRCRRASFGWLKIAIPACPPPAAGHRTECPCLALDVHPPSATFRGARGSRATRMERGARRRGGREGICLARCRGGRGGSGGTHGPERAIRTNPAAAVGRRTQAARTVQSERHKSRQK